MARARRAEEASCRTRRGPSGREEDQQPLGMARRRGLGSSGHGARASPASQAEAARRRREETQRYWAARVQLQGNMTAPNTCPLGGWPCGAAVGSDFHLETLKLFTGGDRRPRSTNLHTPALNRQPKTRVNSCKRHEWSHFEMEPELPPQRDRPVHLMPQTLDVRTAFGQSLKQHCIPKNCLQG